jgi:meiotically up-regulated gene 157 (Mug157) protein
MNLTSETIASVTRIADKFSVNEKQKKIFINCFLSTLNTTTKIIDDSTTFIFTGDIPAMWLRDSSAQVRHYIPFARMDRSLQRVIEGLIRRQINYIHIDPYANAFNEEPNNNGFCNDITLQNPWVWERKYEIDSLCYPISLAWQYWKATGISSIFDENFHHAVDLILDLWTTEQHHPTQSKYSFMRNYSPESDTLTNGGKGLPVKEIGLTWSGFRPSDDACKYGYLIPSNMFAVVVLRYIGNICESVWNDEHLYQKAKHLEQTIDAAIHQYGIIRHADYGSIYAYEVDGFGNYLLMDDANVPSLLSIPYLGYTSCDDQIYQNTRRFVLSKDNPCFYTGKFAKGIGSPHTPNGNVWPIGLAMQGLTAASAEETDQMIELLINADGNTGVMHESFHPDNPDIFTRSWFAWADSLFAELIIKRYCEVERE